MNEKEKRAYAKMRRDTKDETVKPGVERTERVDLGLALLEVLILPKQSLSRYDIAVWCGCTDAGIYMLEKKALKKLRNKIRFGKAAELGKEIVA